jgi:tRNA nucleotidyltransferase (CCA-adding enzyme)
VPPEQQIISEAISGNNDSRYIALLLAALIPWVDAPLSQPAKAGGKMPLSAPASVAREGIKATNKICDVINASDRNLADIVSVKDRIVERKRYPHRQVVRTDPAGRDILGMAIRSWGTAWRSQVFWALLSEYTVIDYNHERRDR